MNLKDMHILTEREITMITPAIGSDETTFVNGCLCTTERYHNDD